MEKQTPIVNQESKVLTWRIHLPNLLAEIMNNDTTAILRVPLNILSAKLERMAEIASRINDDELNLIMCELALYQQGDPTHADYMPEIFDILKERIKNKE